MHYDAVFNYVIAYYFPKAFVSHLTQRIEVVEQAVCPEDLRPFGRKVYSKQSGDCKEQEDEVTA